MGWIRTLGDIGMRGCQHLDLVQPGPRHSWGPCPACGALARSESSPHDKRLALHSGGKAEGRGWWCARCEAKGDAADLVALHVTGRRIRDLDREGRRQLRAWVADRVSHIDPAAEPLAQRTPPPAPKPPEYPPAGPLRELWAHSWAFGGPWGYPVRDIIDYATSRAGAGHDVIADTGLCRILPPREGRPRLDWWPYDNAWRLAFGLYDAHGDLRSILCRTHRGDVAARKGKERSPYGHARSELLLADSLGLDLLRQRGPAPSLVWIVEGPTSALRLACQMRLAGTVDPVLGVFSGSISALSDVAWPSRTVIAIATDDDRQGDAYAAQIRSALPALQNVKRVHWRVLDTHREASCA